MSDLTPLVSKQIDALTKQIESFQVNSPEDLKLLLSMWKELRAWITLADKVA